MNQSFYFHRFYQIELQAWQTLNMTYILFHDKFKNWLTFGQYYHFPLGKNSVEIMLKLYTDYYVQVQFTKHLYSVQKLQHRLT